MGLLAAAIQGDKSIRAPPAPRTTESATMSSSETAEANRLRKLAELQETLELAVQAREAEVDERLMRTPHIKQHRLGAGVRYQVNTVSVKILR